MTVRGDAKKVAELGTQALEVARQLRAYNPELPVVLLTEAPEGLVGLATDRVERTYPGSGYVLPETMVRAVMMAHFQAVLDEAERRGLK